MIANPARPTAAEKLSAEIEANPIAGAVAAAAGASADPFEIETSGAGLEIVALAPLPNGIPNRARMKIFSPKPGHTLGVFLQEEPGSLQPRPLQLRRPRSARSLCRAGGNRRMACLPDLRLPSRQAPGKTSPRLPLRDSRVRILPSAAHSYCPLGKAKLPVNISAMANVEDSDITLLVVDLVDNPKITDAEAPTIAPC